MIYSLSNKHYAVKKQSFDTLTCDQKTQFVSSIQVFITQPLVLKLFIIEKIKNETQTHEITLLYHILL